MTFIGAMIAFVGAMILFDYLRFNGYFAGDFQRRVVFTDNAQKEESVNIDTSNWKTYTNTKYLFEIKYPPGWTVRAEDRHSHVNPFFSTDWREIHIKGYITAPLWRIVSFFSFSTNKTT